MPGLFSGTDVPEFEGDNAKNLLAAHHTLPNLVMYYHPMCPSCKQSIKEFTELAKETNKNGTGVRIEAINMSTLRKKEVGIDHYPTWRLFKDDNSVIEYETTERRARDKDDFKKFLKANGVFGSGSEQPNPNVKTRKSDKDIIATAEE